jgi:hypothetical protein
MHEMMYTTHTHSHTQTNARTFTHTQLCMKFTNLAGQYIWRENCKLAYDRDHRKKDTQIGAVVTECSEAVESECRHVHQLHHVFFLKSRCGK